MFLFFKQKTAYEMRISDWSSDVCSSDLFTWVQDDGIYALCNEAFNLLYLVNSCPLGIVNDQAHALFTGSSFHRILYFHDKLRLQAQHGDANYRLSVISPTPLATRQQSGGKHRRDSHLHLIYHFHFANYFFRSISAAAMMMAPLMIC